MSFATDFKQFSVFRKTQLLGLRREAMSILNTIMLEASEKNQTLSESAAAVFDRALGRCRQIDLDLGVLSELAAFYLERERQYGESFDTHTREDLELSRLANVRAINLLSPLSSTPAELLQSLAFSLFHQVLDHCCVISDCKRRSTALVSDHVDIGSDDGAVEPDEWSTLDTEPPNERPFRRHVVTRDEPTPCRCAMCTGESESKDATAILPVTTISDEELSVSCGTHMLCDEIELRARATQRWAPWSRRARAFRRYEGYTRR